MSHSQRRDDPLQGVRDAVGTNTLVLAVVGALVAFLTAFVPGSPVVGGLLVGWLHRDDPRQGGKVGALAGLLFALPTVFLTSLVFGVFVGASLFGAIPAAFGLAAFLLFALGTAYTVGLGAVGGYVGAILYQRRFGAPQPSETSGARSRDDQFDDTQF
jgi:hypothetical protein